MEPILIHQCGYLFVSEWDRDPDHSHDPHFHLYKMSDECLQEYGPSQGSSSIGVGRGEILINNSMRKNFFARDMMKKKVYCLLTFGDKPRNEELSGNFV